MADFDSVFIFAVFSNFGLKLTVWFRFGSAIHTIFSNNLWKFFEQPNTASPFLLPNTFYANTKIP